jgi:alkylation response protein AidB-like acyl-CoA dehydrogenase
MNATKATKEEMPRDFGFGSDEELVRDSARKLLDEAMPVTKLRALVASDPDEVYVRGERPAWDPELWKQMVELGWTGLPIPEEHGGVGFKTVGIAGLVEEVGRHALPSPLVPTLASAYVLREALSAEGGPAAAWLTRIADGAAATLAITDARGSWEPRETDVVAEPDGDGFRLTGAACFVQDAFKAQLLVVHAVRGGEHLLCVLPADTPGVRLAQDHIHDLTRDQATVHFDGVRVSPEQVVHRDAVAVLERAWPALLVLVAADLCGSSEWQLQTTVEYARTRKQFDRPIGFFQAVKHPLSDGMVMIDRARSLLYHAACCIDSGSREAENAARMAKSAASDAGAFLSDRSVQLHGGIGFTWECDVHLYFKRSLHDQALYGDAVHQRRKLADALIGPIES